ncbi:6-bladed beta-propeller [Aquiflexum gelatinilyticum]|uniref:6-bladed beta-propeller n=1 Tax=Aquiflexum gelatinilyticum TaxID=2961943 RepID=A0A9X2T3G9_9BACT|nr:6-bladed beta-propeller [Aquiflexum gelatinilyticum]MCR9016355.1 6-bladed beta-propeller [Aquiflexum gelatinilyticum]
MSKYKLKLLLHIVFCGSLLFGCNSKPIDKNVEIILVGDSEPQFLSKIIDNIEYIVFENPNKPFVKADKLFVFDGGIILADFWSNHTLFRYDQNGKFINPIGRFGEGPGEYVQITDVDFDESNNNLIVVSRNHLITYSIEDEFIDEIELRNRPYKFLKLDGEKYLFYFPEVLAPELRAGIDRAILYNYSTDLDSLEPIFDPVFPEKINGMGEKNNLFKLGETVLFSSNFCDTIYMLSKDGIEKKFFLDFGSEQNDLSKLYGLSIPDLVKVLNGEAFKNISIHMPHLFGNSRYLTSAFRKKTGFDFFVYDMKDKIPYLSSKSVNDVDGGLGFGIIKRMDDDYFYSFFEPEEILQHYEKNIDQLKDQDNNFTKLATQITRDDFLILAKYKLKK